MKSRLALSLGVLAVGALSIGACTPAEDDDATGMAGVTGSAGTGSAGTTGAAGTGSNTQGTAGTTGAAGTGSNPQGTAGTTGTAGTGAAGTGTAGTTGAAGTGAAGTGAAGTGGGAAGTGAASGDTRKGMSAGCGNAPPGGDSSSKYTKHDITVTGVDPAYIAAHPANVGGYTFTKRNYFVKLPANYSPDTAYALHFGGGGCGNTNGLSGEGGGFGITGAAPGAIQVGLSYVFGDGQGACFQDGGVNSPDVPYFDSVMKEIEANYCFDKGKVFIGGYSSGAWLAYSLGYARGNVIRGIATAAGGIRKDRWPAANKPFAAFLLTGQGDGANPIDGPTGSALARDAILTLNKCNGTNTTAWPDMAACVQYTGCPAAFPVIWCTPGGGHTDGGGAWKTAISKGWGSLPAVP
jgi:hypothetical protein